MAVDWMDKDNRKRLKKVTPQQGPNFTYDINYAGDKDFHHCFDLLKADDNKRLNRLFIDIHGGAYVFGIRKNNYPYASIFREAGYDVAIADYDLVSQGVTVENQIHDVAKMLKYLHDHAAELGIADDAFFISGDSSGGHLSLLLGEAISDPKVASALGVDLSGVTASAVLVNCTAFDFTHILGKDHCTKAAALYIFGPRYQDEAWCDRFSPKTYLSSLRLPLFYSSCRNDPLLPETLKLQAALKGLGIPNKYCYIDSPKKEISHVHNISFPDYPESQQVNTAMMAFMAKYSAHK